MKVLVVAPKNATKMFPVGLAYIVSSLKRAGHHVDCLNMNIAPELRIDRGVYDIVATGGLACHYSDIEQTVNMARGLGIKTVIGGGIVSSEPELMTRALSVDYSVIGEGEVTICELLRCIEEGHDISTIPGIAFLRNDAFTITDARKPTRELDALPFPDYESLGFLEHLDNLKPSDVYYLDYFDHPRGYPLVCSRSCPYTCTFCYHPLGQVYRQRSVESILQEIREVVPKYRINVLEILDELFARDKEWLRAFCGGLKQFQKTLSWELKWGCQLRVGSIDAETLGMLSDAGCYSLSLGLESYSRDVLISMKKRTTPEQIHRAIHLILDTDMRLQGNFIFGDKAETMATAKETMEFWKEHAHAGVLLGFVQPYPNSELYQYCLQSGVIKDRLDFIKNHLFDVINMTAISGSEFFGLRIEVLRIDFKYNRYAIPKSVGHDSVTITCPHCRETLTYRNYDIVEKNSYLFSVRQNRLLYKKMMYCRKCGRRFWARSLFAQIMTAMVTTILKYPSFAVKVMHLRNILFGCLRRGGRQFNMRGISSPLEVLNKLMKG